jgi:hypothetical protein
LNSRAIVQLLCCAATLVATSAQAPPSPAPALPDKPLRHMEFAYSVDYQRLGEQHQGDIGTGGSGVVSTAAGAGRQGTLTADVIGVAKDGGLVIRTSEWLQSTPRASQSFVCAVFPEGRVVCPEHLDVTDAENEIMTYLGRGFLDPSIIDDKGQWQRQFSNKYVAVTANFIVTGNPDANPLAIDAKTTITSIGGLSSNWDDTAHLTYDRMLDVPVTLHDVAIEHARGNQSTQTTMDFKLTKDSLAPAKP